MHGLGFLLERGRVSVPVRGHPERVEGFPRGCRPRRRPGEGLDRLALHRVALRRRACAARS